MLQESEEGPPGRAKVERAKETVARRASLENMVKEGLDLDVWIVERLGVCVRVYSTEE